MENKNLHTAKRNKNDEFFTRLTDIENELYNYWYYTNHFADKTVYCNCDDTSSAFIKYFALQFEHLGLRKIVATHFRMDGGRSYKIEITHPINDVSELDAIERIPLKHNGDFRSKECIELLQESDIVVTNPPFSLFRDYVAQLVKYDKSFLIIGNANAITYKEIFPLLKENRMWLGATKPQLFLIEDKENFAKYCSDSNKVIIDRKEFWEVNISVGTPTYWFTNLSHSKRNEKLILTEEYSASAYPKYDNYDAIEVSRVANIPKDYDGIMGVPITFLDKYNPDQFEIMGGYNYSKDFNGKTWNAKINGKYVYKRILIKRKEDQ